LHLELMQNLLRPLGFTVFAARDGKTCIQLALQCQPDLAMIDLSMPDLSGWDVARQLRASPDLAGMKIMIVSANAYEFSPGVGAEHDLYVTKPIDLSLLLGQIGVLLGLKLATESDTAHTVGTTERSRHHLDDLYRLGRIGHVRGIEAKLRELELEDPSNKAVAAQLRELVSSFDLKRYLNVLEAMRANA
jgi:CheY-like chemotaxis protein